MMILAISLYKLPGVTKLCIPPLDTTSTTLMNILHIYSENIVTCDLIQQILSRNSQSLEFYDHLYTGCIKITFIKDYRVKL